MKLTFIGVGSAFSKKNFNSGVVIEIPGREVDGREWESVSIPPRRLMIDCGRTAPEALAAVGLTWHDIDALYVSHAHADHVGGIEEFAFSRMFIPPKSKPTICGEQDMLNDLWDHTLRGGLGPATGDKRFRLNSYFDPIYVELHGPTRGFTWQRMWFRLIEMPHIMPSYGVYFETPSTQSHPYGRGVLYTSDTSAVVRPSDPMDDFYRRASIIFQDCETAPYKSGVHTHYSDLRTLPDDLKRKMWLYHYQDALPLPDAKADGFAGFVTKGQTFDF